MYQYLNAFTNRSGDALPGYFARLFDAGGNVVALFSDNNGTPIATVSGVANAALSDDNGMFRWFVANGTYDMRFYDSNDTFVSAETGVPMIEASGVYSDLASDEAGKGASLVVMESGDTVQDAIDATQGSVAGKVDLDGTNNVRIITSASNPAAYNLFLQSGADGKQVDGAYAYHEVAATALSAGYGFHAVTYSYSGVADGVSGGLGGAQGGPGGGSGVIGNRGDDGTGCGGVFTRLGTGLGNGVEGRNSSTAEGSAGYFLKQNPGAGTAGAGPAAWFLNNSTNGEAFRARSASGNLEENTGIVDRLNGAFGTGLFTRITGGGARTAALKGGATHIVPSVSSTGSSLVYGYDIQINSNVTGATDTRGLNVVNNAGGAGESYGVTVTVNGARTTNYGLYLSAANATTNYGLFVAAGKAYFGGEADTLSQYQVGGVKVVGARGAAVADATDAASVILRLNELLARVRAHGLIS